MSLANSPRTSTRRAPARTSSLGRLALFGLALALGPGEGEAGARTSGETTALAEHALTTLRGASEQRQAFEYSLSMPDPQRHEFHVRLRFEGIPGDRVQLRLPKWNPGAYHLTNAHRNVRAVRAELLGDGDPEPLGVAKVDENTWELAHGGAAFALEYRVYCGSYSGIAGCYLDDEFGFVNGVHLFMYAVGHKQRAIELRVSELPGGRGAEVVTGLPARGSGKRKHFWANNYDALVDSPIHAGDVDIVRFELGDRPIRAAFSREGAWKADEVRDELRRIAEASAAVFGPVETALPFTDYTFIYHVMPDNSGGLEHRNSTVIGVDPWWFADERGKRRFWSVSAHEFFHLWNVKRIRPAVLGPFDYDREVHTTMLWFSEGFTSYYAILIQRRAGLIDEHDALEDLAGRIAALETKPGRKLMSVEQSSWETWSRPDDYAKAYFSYYDKGAVIGMILDLALRHASKGQASTDTVFRELWQRWRETGLGLTPEQLEQVFIDQAGAGADEIRQIFTDYVHGVEELDYDRYLAHAGYRLERSQRHHGPWIGAEVRRTRGEVHAQLVLHDGPGDRGGLADGDRIRAIDGHVVTADNYGEILASLELGRAHTFTVERTGRVLELELEPIEGGDERFEIVELDQVSRGGDGGAAQSEAERGAGRETPEMVSAEQMLLRKEWLGLE